MQGNRRKRRYIYGPVPSRRLGLSLGVDLIPYKICSYDCIYCQLGKTTEKTIKRGEYFNKNEIVLQIKEEISQKERIDYITFSGSGEPTLNNKIGEIIADIKRITTIPVAVLTNGSLLYNAQVRKSLFGADLVVPSLDAASETTFRRINKPYRSITFKEMVKGILDFSNEFSGKIWLEIMLVKGINDSREEIEKFKKIISKGRFDKVQLNTVVRPPSEKIALPLGIEKLESIKNLIGDNCEIIAGFKANKQKIITAENEQRILEMLKRRPVTLNDISTSLGIHPNEVIKYLDKFQKNGIIKILNFNRKMYYEIK